MWDKIIEIIKRILDKSLSARFIIAILFSTAACVGFIKDKIPAEAFMVLLTMIVKDYFNRDRQAPTLEGK